MIWGIIALAGIVFAIILYERKAGRDAEKAAEGARNADATKRIVDSQSDTPHDDAELLERMRDPERKL